MGYFSSGKKTLLKLTVLNSLFVVGIGSSFSIVNASGVAPNPRDQAFLLSPKKTFDYYCSPCHGAKGKGDGTFFTIDLKPKPRNLTDVDYMSKRTDDQLIKSITGGTKAVDKSNLCPPWGGTLSEKKIKELVAYIRSLSQKEAEKPVVVAKEQVVEVKESSTFKTSVRWAFLIVITFGLVVGAMSELRKLKSETK